MIEEFNFQIFNLLAFDKVVSDQSDFFFLILYNAMGLLRFHSHHPVQVVINRVISLYKAYFFMLIIFTILTHQALLES
jgi:hypothetical protein